MEKQLIKKEKKRKEKQSKIKAGRKFTIMAVILIAIFVLH